MLFTNYFIFVEGNDDENFIEKVIKPIFKHSTIRIRIIKYSQMSSNHLANILKSISHSSTYIILGDYDSLRDHKLTLNKRRIEINHKFKNLGDLEKIFIVIEEIESWYFAGLDEEFLYKNNLPEIPNTENLSKEKFNKLIIRNFKNINDFKFEILKNYNLLIAVNKNKSLKKFMRFL